MGVPYKATVTVTKPGATAVSAALLLQARGDLTSVIVRQENPDDASGTDAFSVDVFDQDPDDFTVANPEETHKVIPTQNGAGGKMEYFPDCPKPFINQDLVGLPSGRPKKLYVRVSGAGTNKFHVAAIASAPLD